MFVLFRAPSCYQSTSARVKLRFAEPSRGLKQQSPAFFSSTNSTVQLQGKKKIPNKIVFKSVFVQIFLVLHFFILLCLRLTAAIFFYAKTIPHHKQSNARTVILLPSYIRGDIMGNKVMTSAVNKSLKIRPIYLTFWQTSSSSFL